MPATSTASPETSLSTNRLIYWLLTLLVLGDCICFAISLFVVQPTDGLSFSLDFHNPLVFFFRSAIGVAIVARWGHSLITPRLLIIFLVGSLAALIGLTCESHFAYSGLGMLRTSEIHPGDEALEYIESRYSSVPGDPAVPDDVAIRILPMTGVDIRRQVRRMDSFVAEVLERQFLRRRARMHYAALLILGALQVILIVQIVNLDPPAGLSSDRADRGSDPSPAERP